MRCYFKYALRVLLVTLCDLALRVVIKIINGYFTLSTDTYFDWFPLHTWMEASFGVIFTHGVYQNVTGFHVSLITYAQWSHSAISDYTLHHNPWWTRWTGLTRIRFTLVLWKTQFTLDDKFHFCGKCIVMIWLRDGAKVNNQYLFWNSTQSFLPILKDIRLFDARREDTKYILIGISFYTVQINT